MKDNNNDDDKDLNETLSCGEDEEEQDLQRQYDPSFETLASEENSSTCSAPPPPPMGIMDHVRCRSGIIFGNKNKKENTPPAVTADEELGDLAAQIDLDLDLASDDESVEAGPPKSWLNSVGKNPPKRRGLSRQGLLCCVGLMIVVAAIVGISIAVRNSNDETDASSSFAAIGGGDPAMETDEPIDVPNTTTAPEVEDDTTEPPIDDTISTTEAPIDGDTSTESPTEGDTATDNPTEDDMLTESPSDGVTGTGTATVGPTEDSTEDDTSTESPTEGDTATDNPTEDDMLTESPTEGDTATDNPTEDDMLTESPTDGVSATDSPVNGVGSSVILTGTTCYAPNSSVDIVFENTADPRGDDWVGIWSADVDPTSLPEPILWVFTCGSQACSIPTSDASLSFEAGSLGVGSYVAHLVRLDADFDFAPYSGSYASTSSFAVSNAC